MAGLGLKPEVCGPEPDLLLPAPDLLLPAQLVKAQGEPWGNLGSQPVTRLVLPKGKRSGEGAWPARPALDKAPGLLMLGFPLLL